MKQSKEMEELLNTKILARAYLAHAFSAGSNKRDNSIIEKLGDELEDKISQNFTPNSECISKEEVENIIDKEMNKLDKIYKTLDGDSPKMKIITAKADYLNKLNKLLK